MKFDKKWVIGRIKEKSTWVSIIGTVGSMFGLTLGIPVDLLAQFIAAAVIGAVGTAGVAAKTSEK